MLPDLKGYKFDRAMNILKNKGFNNIIVKVTTSPREQNKQPTEEESRVLRITQTKEKNIEILVCN